MAVRGDLADEAALAGALRAHRCSSVLHVASPPAEGAQRKQLEEGNVVGTARVVAACLATGVRALVYTSSASVVWAGAALNGVDERTPAPTVFRDAYAETKAKVRAGRREGVWVGGCG